MRLTRRAHSPSSRKTWKRPVPKFDVEDEQGIQWRVKLGEEPESETAATRFLWAAGYFVDEDYYLAEIKVMGLPKLHRGESFVSADGTVHRRAWNASRKKRRRSARGTGSTIRSSTRVN